MNRDVARRAARDASPPGRADRAGAGARAGDRGRHRARTWRTTPRGLDHLMLTEPDPSMRPGSAAAWRGRPGGPTCRRRVRTGCASRTALWTRSCPRWWCAPCPIRRRRWPKLCGCPSRRTAAVLRARPVRHTARAAAHQRRWAEPWAAFAISCRCDRRCCVTSRRRFGSERDGGDLARHAGPGAPAGRGPGRSG